ncbi:unnamed protein product [Lactuca virosa]|uniref:Myb/SANT-like domain-containing protein n=1 Tax=Lactuca virosa TaxID=75947 RepID=A0AAU9NYM3_9ASTR|nr:unnamed protein product [Lactuca virosa]
MRKDYNLWTSLKIGEIGLGWNESTRQLKCSDEWWNKKIKENPNLKGIPKKQHSLELQEAWDHIFGDAVASGADCMAPSMYSSTLNTTPHVIIDDENPTTCDDVATGDHVQTGDATFFSSQNLQLFDHVDNLEEENAAFYSNFINWVGDVLSPNNTGGSTQLQMSYKESSKLKPVHMKHKNRESVGSSMFKGFMTQQNSIQKRTLELLGSDTFTGNQSQHFSISAAVGLINRMVDDEIMTNESEL